MKRIKYLIGAFILSLSLIMNVNAASGSISVSSSSKTVAVGSTFTVTIKVSCSEASAWRFGVTYDSEFVSLQSGDTYPAFEGDGSTRSQTYTYKFKAIKAGNAGIRISGTDFSDWNTVSSFTPSVSNTTVTVKTQAQIEASYSKDNNLKSLSVDGYELSPAFNKDVTEYNIDVPDDVLSIKVQAKANDANASVRGIGSIDVSEGINKVDVVVTAQNGASKTYTINVNVKDLSPINVEVDGQTFSVVKKESLLTCPVGFTPSTIEMGDNKIPVFASELTGFTLIGLKSETGEINLYIYNENDNTYQLYREVRSSSLTLYPIKTTNVPTGFRETKVTINEVEFEAFKNETDNNFIIIYAMNIENGEKNYYIYDKEENSFVLYNSKIIDKLYDSKKEYNIYFAAMISTLIIFIIMSIALGRKVTKLKKLLLKKTSSTNEITKNKEVKPGEVINKEKQESTDKKSKKSLQK